MFNKFIFISTTLVLVAFCFNGHAEAQNSNSTVILEAEADAYIRNDLSVRRNDNYGCQEFMVVGTDRGGGADAMRALIRFDISEISSVTSAVLELTIHSFDQGTPSSQYTVDVHRIVDSGPLTPWIEGNGTERSPQPPGCEFVNDAFGVAWVGSGDGGDANNQTQPNFDPTVVASATVDQGVNSTGDVIQFDITSLVQDWVEGTSPNHGIMLTDVTSEGSFRGVRFGTKEGFIFDIPGAVDGPRLIITSEDEDLPHPFVLLAEEDIEIWRQVNSEGDIHSNEDVEFGRGGPSTHTGNLTAVKDIEIKQDNTINGDATAGDEVENSGTVTGEVTQNTEVATESLPVLSFSSTGEEIEVPLDSSLTLAPASYGEIEVNKRATLSLSAGEYFMVELEMKRASVLAIDVSDGPVIINLVEELEIKNDAEVVIIPSGEAGTTDVTFNVLGSETVDLHKRSKVLGTIIAPNAKVELKVNSRFKGAICAKEIEVKKGATFLHHTSTTQLPKVTLQSNVPEEENVEIATIPQEYALSQNYPNPFNPTTTITFAMPKPGQVSLKIYNTQGQLLRTLVDAVYQAGRHSVQWDGKDQNGNTVSSGIYFYELTADDFHEVQKMSFIR